MIGLVNFGKVTAGLHEDGHWQCRDPFLQQYLNQEFSLDSYSPSDGSYGVAKINEAAQRLGGRVKLLVPLEDENISPGDEGEGPVRHAKQGKHQVDKNGGVIPEGAALERAKRVDLVTLPPSMDGTRCGNCMHLESGDQDIRYCNEKSVQQYVSAEHNCCAEHDNPDFLRAWEEDR